MPAHDEDEMLSPAQVAEMLTKHTGEQVGKLTVALLYIIGALKRQPNFDVNLFNSRLVEGANSMMNPDDKLIRTILLAAAGEDIEPGA